MADYFFAMAQVLLLIGILPVFWDNSIVLSSRFVGILTTIGLGIMTLAFYSIDAHLSTIVCLINFLAWLKMTVINGGSIAIYGTD